MAQLTKGTRALTLSEQGIRDLVSWADGDPTTRGYLTDEAEAVLETLRATVRKP